MKSKARATAFHRLLRAEHGLNRQGNSPLPRPEPVIHYPIKPLGPVSDLWQGLSFYLKMTVDIQFNGRLGCWGKFSLPNITEPGLQIQGERSGHREAGLSEGRGLYPGGDLNTTAGNSRTRGCRALGVLYLPSQTV